MIVQDTLEGQVGEQRGGPAPLGRYMREALARHGYKNYAEFARRAKVSDQYLRYLMCGYNLQTGGLLEPSIRVLRRCAAALAEQPPSGERAQELEYVGLLRAAGYMPRHDVLPEVTPLFTPSASPAEISRAALDVAAAERQIAREQALRELQAITRRMQQLIRGDAPPLDQVDDPYLPPLDQQ